MESRRGFVILFFFQAEDGIRDLIVTGVQTCALPICAAMAAANPAGPPPTTNTSVVSPMGTSSFCVFKQLDRKSTRLNSSHDQISYAVFCLKKKTNTRSQHRCNGSETYPLTNLPITAS